MCKPVPTDRDAAESQTTANVAAALQGVVIGASHGLCHMTS